MAVPNDEAIYESRYVIAWKSVSEHRQVATNSFGMNQNDYFSCAEGAYK